MSNKYDEQLGNAVVNHEQKCLCVICVDISGSMAYSNNGSYESMTPIQELNEGLKVFQEEIKNDPVLSDRLEVSIVAFNDKVTATEPRLIDSLYIPTYTASGTTNTTEALRQARRIVDDRKAEYKRTAQPYYRPWIILITDGYPDDESSALREAQTIGEGVRNKQYSFLPIGVEDADMNLLQNMAADMPAVQMKGLRFTEFFQWLSNSMGVVAKSSEGTPIGAQIGEGVKDFGSIVA